MSNQTAARLENVTQLIPFRSSKSITITYSYPDAPTPRIPYTKLRIYRFIGKINECSPPVSVNDSGVVLIREINEATVQAQSVAPAGTVFSVVDNLNSRWSEGSTVLRNQHSLTDAIHDKQIMHEIMYTRRPIYYLVESFKRGVSEFIPYCIVPYTNDGSIASYSTKTQVLHDVFHQEGDCIWHTSLSPNPNSISRTAVNILPVIREEAAHTGPTGIGGYVWVSDRQSGGERVFRLSLNTGVQRGASSPLPNNVSPNGHGITIDAITGDCYSSPRHTPVSTIWRLSNQDTINTTANTIIASEPIVTAAYNSTLPLYGAVQRFGTNQHFGSVFGRGGVLFNPSNQTVVSLFNDNIYGIASSRDGLGWAGRYFPPAGQSTLGRYSFSGASPAWKHVAAPRIAFEDSPAHWGGIGVSVDTPNKTTIFNDELYRVGYTNGYNCRIVEYVPSFDNVFPRIDVVFRDSRGIGVDGDNNWYGVGGLQEKFYSCKHNDSFEDKGGFCRYPESQLSQWFGSTVNTREIEWFMTRNGHKNDALHCRVNYTTRQDARNPASPNTLKDGGTLEGYIKAYYEQLYGASSSTHYEVGLDDIVLRNWATGLPTNPGPQTAQQAWSWIVDGNIPGTGNTVGDYRAPIINGRSMNFSDVSHRPGGWNPKYHNGVTAGGTKMWGKRLYEADPSNASVTQARISIVVQYIRAWSRAFADSLFSYIGVSNREALIQKNTRGARVFPHYLGDDIQSGDFPMEMSNSSKRARIERRTVCIAARGNGFSYCYSDFTGSILAASVQEISYGVDRIHPVPIEPALTIASTAVSYSSPLGEASSQFLWSTTNTSNQSVTGYDDLTVTYQLSTNPGTFIISGAALAPGDYLTDYNSASNPSVVTVNMNEVYEYDGSYDSNQQLVYTYHDPSVIGLPGARSPVSATEWFEATAFAFTNRNVYTCQQFDLRVHPLQATVLERWPRSDFVVNGVDGISERYPWLSDSCSHKWGDFGRFERDYNDGGRQYAAIHTGVDPVSAQINDRTIARTYPISSVNMYISAYNPWSGEVQSWTPTSTQGITVTSLQLDTVLPADTRALSDTRILVDRLWRYGTYTYELDVRADFSSTPGATNLGAPQTFKQTLSVAEFEPFANFWAISAQTVPSTYREETSAVDARDLLIPASTAGAYISGYAPNLTVWFQDSSEAHTFPISSYHWDFGDFYDEATNTATITTTAHTGVFDIGCWRMTGFSADKPGILVNNQEGHIVKHTYTMPGTYDVTLCAQASNTQTQDCCARFIDQQFYIYVEEIPPACCFVMKTDATQWTTAPYISGDSPMTLYTLASCVTAGSFPICKIDYDWGDGSPVESVSRVSALTGTSLGTPITSTMQNSDDMKDPRFFIVPHHYTYTEPAPTTSYTIGMTAYACNTNTAAVCTGKTVELNTSYEEQYDNRHLINSRYIGDTNDKVYVFESENLSSTVHVVLSGEIQK